MHCCICLLFNRLRKEKIDSALPVYLRYSVPFFPPPFFFNYFIPCPTPALTGGINRQCLNSPD